MAMQVLDKGDQYVLNYCTKYLARDNTDPRHNYMMFHSCSLMLSKLRIKLCH